MTLIVMFLTFLKTKVSSVKLQRFGESIIRYRIIIHSASADASADVSADMPENRLIKLEIILKHSRIL